jgi:hypothetical protein
MKSNWMKSWTLLRMLDRGNHSHYAYIWHNHFWRFRKWFTWYNGTNNT